MLFHPPSILGHGSGGPAILDGDALSLFQEAGSYPGRFLLTGCWVFAIWDNADGGSSSISASVLLGLERQESGVNRLGAAERWPPAG